MEKVVGFVRVNKNNQEYTQAQIDGINKYAQDNKLNVERTIQVEVNIPDEEKKILKFLKHVKKDVSF